MSLENKISFKNKQAKKRPDPWGETWARTGESLKHLVMGVLLITMIIAIDLVQIMELYVV